MYKIKQKLLLTALLLSGLPVASFADGEWNSAPQDGKFYLISRDNSANFLLQTHVYSGIRDTGLAFEPTSSNDQATKWKLVKAGNAENCYVVLDAVTGMAVDMSLNNKAATTGYPCVWAYNPSNTNQQVFITPVEGGGYKLSAKSKLNGGTYYVSSQSQESGAFFDFKYTNNESAAVTVYLQETTAAPVNDWENEQVYAINKERGHATYMPYSTTEAMHADKNRYDKPWLEPQGANYMSLNGTWKLKWNEALKVSLLDSVQFWGNNVVTTGNEWHDIPVPSCLEMHGYGSPMYINVDYPFTDTPPYINMRNVGNTQLKNAVGSYRRDFDLPEGWSTKRIFLHFDGIYSAAYVYVNGHKVGYTQGANNVSEFDVTSYVRPGRNNVSVAVIRWSDGSYLEGQDMWHMSGIHRDVYLYATPKTYIADHYIKSTVSPYTNDASTRTGIAQPQVTLTVCNRDKEAVTKNVKVTIYDPEGKLYKSLNRTITFNAGDSVKTTIIDFGQIFGVKLWSAETPTLYTFEISQSANGQEEEAFSTKYGFRKIDLSAGYLKINGQRTFLKGANTQDTDPKQGRTYGIDLMLKDITMMKQANMNTVRTSHYPRQAKMMAMFDYYGLYVVDEADMECHKNWEDGSSIVRTDSWKDAIVDRNVRNTLRDRNHPSVVFWSLGNESGAGPNIVAAYDAVKKLDGRYIHYEGSTRANAAGSDLHSRMYPTIDASINQNLTQPYFMCEYAHAMGNAVGNLKEYWDNITKSPKGVGGCIWDWVDQSIFASDVVASGEFMLNGFPRYITGFDCPGPHQQNFVNNGLINADRSWSSELDEVKRIYQWVDFSLNSANKQLTLTNNYLDRNLSDFILKWTLLVDGKPQQSGTSDLSCLPRKSQVIELNYDLSQLSGKEVFLNAELLTKAATPWCDKDYPMAQTQVMLQERIAAFTSAPKATAVLSDQALTDGGHTYSTDKMSVTFDANGNITAWNYDGTKLFQTGKGPKYENYRFVENDNPTEPYFGSNYLTDNGVTSQNATFTLNNGGKTATVEVSQTGRNCNTTYSYTIYPDGTIDVKSNYTVVGADTRRMGFSVEFPKEFQNVNYYARGPRASYIDRLDGEDYGIYETKADSMYEAFAKPQSNGNHMGLRWMTLSNDNGKGIRVETIGETAFSLNPWNDVTLRNTRHEWQLPQSESIVAHFDAIQKGLGNASCGPATLSDYVIKKDNQYSNTVRFSPFGFDGSHAAGIKSMEDQSSLLNVTSNDHRIFVRGNLPAGTKITAYTIDGKAIGSKTLKEAETEATLRVNNTDICLVKVIVNGMPIVKKIKI